MKKNQIWKFVGIAVLVIILVIGVVHYSSMDFSIVTTNESDDEEYISGTDHELSTITDEKTCIVKVLESIQEIDSYDEFLGMYRLQTLRVEVLTGPRKGQIHYADFNLSDATGKKPNDYCKPGDKLLCFFSVTENGTIYGNGTITNYYRTPYIVWAAVIFLLFLLVLTGMRGLKSIAALLATCAGIILIFLPMILSGMSPVLASILACIFAVITSLLLVYGYTIKTLAAALGAIGGVIVAGIFCAVINSMMHMTGAVDSEAIQLGLHFVNSDVDLNGIMFAAILIGSLGGTIDVGISIASSLDEMREHAPGITAAEMTASGIKIGSDIMGASLNTLILAYVGSTIHLLLMLRINGIRMVDIFSEEIIASELVRALAGSFGLLFTVPITSFVAGAMLCKGSFGKFTLDMIPTIAALKTGITEFSSKWKDSVENARHRMEQEEQPDNLYINAVQRSSEIDFEENNEEESEEDNFEDI